MSIVFQGDAARGRIWQDIFAEAEPDLPFHHWPESGRISTAVLDVAGIEPLRAGHPFWTHPGIVLTPHIASMTQPDTVARVLLDNIRRHRAGEPMIGRVDLGRGY